MRALTIDAFHGDTKGVGIEVASSGNLIVGNYIGTDSSGLESRPNTVGIQIDSGTQNGIGGSNALDPNVISGNSADGIDVAARPHSTITLPDLIRMAAPVT